MSIPSGTGTQAEQQRPWLNNNVLPRDGYKEGSMQEEPLTPRLLLLDEENAPTVSVAVEELQAKWIDRCIEQSRPKDMDLFSLRAAIPLLLREDSLVVFHNATSEMADSDEIYVTEAELRRLWIEASGTAMGKPVDKFTVDDALLLLTDEEDEVLLGDYAQALDNEALKISYDSAEGATVVDDRTEYIVTQRELERIWSERAEVSWGLPAKSFDAELSMLLIDDDDDDDNDYTSAIEASEGPSAAIRAPSAYDIAYPSPEDAELSEAILDMHRDLDDPSYVRPAWRKDRHILTPDIDTQRFMGDIMLSNTYMTQRVPANWEDPELEGMSESYLSSGTMSMPGEEETDFNLRRPMWEVLGMPADGTSAPEKRSLGPAGSGSSFDSSSSNDGNIKQATTENIDWSSVDFATIDAEADGGSVPSSASRSALAAAAAKSAVVPTPLATADIIEYLDLLHAIEYEEEEDPEEPAIETTGMYTAP